MAGFIPFLNNSRTISALNGRRLIEIGRVSSWKRGSFIASIGHPNGIESDILSISFCLEGQTPRISYKRVGSSTLGFKILYKMEENILKVYLWSSVTSDSMLCISGLSSHSIEFKEILNDVSAYNEVVSL